MKKILVSLCIVMIAIVSTVTFISCSNEETAGDKVVTDLLGREVTVPNDPQRIVCVGAGALRLYTYIGDLSKLAGVENVEKTDSTYGTNLAIRPYKEVNQELFNSLKDCGKGGPKNQTAEPEAIIECNPDLIISLMSLDKDGADTLQQQTGTPVIQLSYGSNVISGEPIVKSIELLGKVLNKEERATEIINYMTSLKTDINNRTKDIAEASKPSVYLGCQSFYGVGGFLRTTANYPVFNIANIKNAITADKIVTDNSETDMEKIVAIDPDKIIIDLGGLNTMKGEYAVSEKAAIYNSLTAMKNGEVYVQLPYNAYYTNIEVLYINAYYVASVVYPEAFSDVNIVTKADEIFTKFLGKSFYAEISAKYGELRRLDLAATFENYTNE